MAAVDLFSKGKLFSTLAHQCLGPVSSFFPRITSIGKDCDRVRDQLLETPRCVYSSARTLMRGTAELALDHHLSRLGELQPEIAPPPAWLSSSSGRLDQFLPATKLALTHFHFLNSAVHPHPFEVTDQLPEEAKISFILTPTLDFYVHVAELGQVPPSGVVEINASAAPRDNPSVKSTDWVHKRHQWEKPVSSGINETILCSDGKLYEGL